jgi:uncharacterized protein YyaL (SSP411 family)
METPKNRLSLEQSPYLLQHAENPVDWRPWGEEAFVAARLEDKPVFLSVGYSSCHWCHVMARESFEDPEVGRLLNAHFISVKVDREERPDVDQVYMSVCQAITGRGGWPLSVLLLPDGRPFFAGAYFPKHSRAGMPGFLDLMSRVAALWKNDRSKLLATAEAVTRELAPKGTGGSTPSPALGRPVLSRAFSRLAAAFDPVHGGFGSAPKFPTPHNLTFLLRWHRLTGEPQALAMAEKTLLAIRAGGIFDQLGLGVHRYSVDARWLVPHFEKMLYDQALVAGAATEAWLATGNPAFADTARDIFTYVLRDMTGPEGGFYSAEDADSEGHEGRFYVWTPGQVKNVLGTDEGDLFSRFYGVSPGGNFENGASVLHIRRSIGDFARKAGGNPVELEKRLALAREKLLDARASRTRPMLDDKVLTGWNGLMAAALAKGAAALDAPHLLSAAERALNFIWETLRDTNGRLLRRFRGGEAALPGYLEDYAWPAWGLLETYQASLKPVYLERALELARSMPHLFGNGTGGGLYETAKNHGRLLYRPREVYDGATPSGNSVALDVFSRLARLAGDTGLERQAEEIRNAFSPLVAAHPMGYTHFLGAVAVTELPGREIVLAGTEEEIRPWARAARRRFSPETCLSWKGPGETGARLAPLLPCTEGMKTPETGAAAYICQGRACQAPVTDLAGFERALEDLPYH